MAPRLGQVEVWEEKHSKIKERDNATVAYLKREGFANKPMIDLPGPGGFIRSLCIYGNFVGFNNYYAAEREYKSYLQMREIRNHNLYYGDFFKWALHIEGLSIIKYCSTQTIKIIAEDITDKLKTLFEKGSLDTRRIALMITYSPRNQDPATVEEDIMKIESAIPYRNIAANNIYKEGSPRKGESSMDSVLYILDPTQRADETVYPRRTLFPQFSQSKNCMKRQAMTRYWADVARGHDPYRGRVGTVRELLELQTRQFINKGSRRTAHIHPTTTDKSNTTSVALDYPDIPAFVGEKLIPALEQRSVILSAPPKSGKRFIILSLKKTLPQDTVMFYVTKHNSKDTKSQMDDYINHGINTHMIGNKRDVDVATRDINTTISGSTKEIIIAIDELDLGSGHNQLLSTIFIPYNNEKKIRIVLLSATPEEAQISNISDWTCLQYVPPSETNRTLSDYDKADKLIDAQHTNIYNILFTDLLFEFEDKAITLTDAFICDQRPLMILRVTGKNRKYLNKLKSSFENRGIRVVIENGYTPMEERHIFDKSGMLNGVLKSTVRHYEETKQKTVLIINQINKRGTDFYYDNLKYIFAYVDVRNKSTPFNTYWQSLGRMLGRVPTGTIKDMSTQPFIVMNDVGAFLRYEETKDIDKLREDSGRKPTSRSERLRKSGQRVEYIPGYYTEEEKERKSKSYPPGSSTFHPARNRKNDICDMILKNQNRGGNRSFIVMDGDPGCWQDSYNEIARLYGPWRKLNKRGEIVYLGFEAHYIETTGKPSSNESSYVAKNSMYNL